MVCEPCTTKHRRHVISHISAHKEWTLNEFSQLKLFYSSERDPCPQMKTCVTISKTLGKISHQTPLNAIHGVSVSKHHQENKNCYEIQLVGVGWGWECLRVLVLE